MTSQPRTYPVPRAVCSTARPRVTGDPVFDLAVRAARLGKVSSHQLPVLASGSWESGREWANAVLDREQSSRQRRLDALLASVQYAPDDYVYHGVLEPSYPEVELLTSVVRSTAADSPLEVWDGLGWGEFDLGEDDVVYAVLDQDTLAELLEALAGGSGGLVLRPTEPRAWLPARGGTPIDQYDVPDAPAPIHSGAMVAFYPPAEVANAIVVDDGEPVEELHLTLAYLGDTAEDSIDYQAVQRAAARWARQVGPMAGEISGHGVFTAGEKPVAYASVDLPDLPDARQLLIRLLEAEGVEVASDHGYTPHITLKYSKEDLSVPAVPVEFGHVSVVYADDRQDYQLGAPVIASGGAGPGTLYAIVDEYDTAAVLDIVRIAPGPTAYRREAGKWTVDREMLLRLMGVDPPPVVEVSPEQATDVIAQVDAHDQEKGITAAGMWDESKYKRQGGKFAKKNGAGGASGVNKQTPGRGPSRGAPAGSGVGVRPGGGSSSPGGAGRPSSGGGGTLYDLPKSVEASGVGEAFFDGQPAGFEKWLRGFLAKQAAPAPKSETKKDDKASDDDKNDAESKAARDKATKEAKANAEAGTSGANSDDAEDRPSWWDEVPEEYRGAMQAFLRAKEGAAAAKAAAPARRVAGEDARDRDFDLKFAKEGLGESRRREMAVKGLQDLRDRLGQAGADPGAIARMMTAKVAEEKRVREEFARRRRLAVEQERVRRLAHRNAEKDRQDRDAGLVAASMMPAKLKTFWTKGEGAAKIRWGTGGDFGRCERALKKYLKPGQVAGACANLHKLATGTWPGKGKGH